MIQDINNQLEEVKNIELVAIREYNVEADVNEWFVHLVNNQEKDLEVIIMVSKGFDEERSTTVMRRQLDKLPAHSSAKMEYLPEQLFVVNNQYQVTYFQEGKVHEITFVIKANTLPKEDLLTFGYMGNKKGILATKK